ncbi:MAG: hypothetical protein NZ482_08370 [Gloeomargarita sp. SKYG98]|nr:hypothetical protein [Gloeomargarita sp. SKYG98]
MRQPLEQQVSQSEMGSRWASNPLLEKNVWSFQDDLGYSKEECRVMGCKFLHFDRLQLPWLKYLVKLTVPARVQQQAALGTVLLTFRYLSALDRFLREQSITDPIAVTSRDLDTFMFQTSDAVEQKQQALTYVTKLWREGGWLDWQFVPTKVSQPSPSVKVIPEEILHQVPHPRSKK